MRGEKPGCYGVQAANEPQQADYYSSPRVGADVVLPILKEEIQRVSAGQDDLRRMVTTLVNQRTQARPELDFGLMDDFPGLDLESLDEEPAVDPAAEAEVGRALLRAQHYADCVRRTAQTEARRLLLEARAAAEELENEAIARREEAECEIQAMAVAASEMRQRLLDEARTRAEVVQAAEAAMQRRLTELVADVKRVEQHLDTMNHHRAHSDTELISRLGRLVHFLEPAGEGAARAGESAAMNSSALAPA